MHLSAHFECACRHEGFILGSVSDIPPSAFVSVSWWIGLGPSKTTEYSSIPVVQRLEPASLQPDGVLPWLVLDGGSCVIVMVEIKIWRNVLTRTLKLLTWKCFKCFHLSSQEHQMVT
jgi:hypothetical protein